MYCVINKDETNNYPFVDHCLSELNPKVNGMNGDATETVTYSALIFQVAIKLSFSPPKHKAKTFLSMLLNETENKRGIREIFT